jgi:UPF0176 protein
MQDYQILLYYKYVTIPYPERILKNQRKLCERLGLKGRIIIANEGINGTVEGSVSATEAYIHSMNKSRYFRGIIYKRSVGTGESFPKLSVRVRPEIVTSGVTGLNPQKVTGKYITADELHEWYQQEKEFYLVDMRNDYEYVSGYFENFIPSGMKHFFELKDVLPRIQHLKNKTVITVCTGGIRCEKASGFLVENGFTDVYQLKDGIQTYMEKYPNQYFKGKLYVFDKRITLAFNTESSEHEVVGRCEHCGKVWDGYQNCMFDDCHRHYLCCNDCLDLETGLAFCKKDCKEKYLHSKQQRGSSTATQSLSF